MASTNALRSTVPVAPVEPHANGREVGVASEPGVVIARHAGSAPHLPYPDPITAELAKSVRWWHRMQKLAKGAKTANQPERIIKLFESAEGTYKRQIDNLIRQHALWPWLEPLHGLRGPYAAWLIARIRDPRRFPGQRCAKGHYLPAIYPVGAPCPVEYEVEGGADRGQAGAPQNVDCGGGTEVTRGTCGATVGPVRRGAGVRSLWHYFGAHVENGRAPRRQKGQKATWVTEARGLLFGPTGIADQIVRHRPQPYGGIYEQQKERLRIARGAEVHAAIGPVVRAGRNGGAGAATYGEVEWAIGLRPFQIEVRARTIAAKAFLGDLLIQWKSRVPLNGVVDRRCEIVGPCGDAVQPAPAEGRAP